MTDTNAFDGFLVATLDTVPGYFSFLDTLRTLSQVELVHPYYLHNGAAFFIGSGIVVIMEESETGDAILELADSMGFEVESQVMQSPNGYRLVNKKETGLTTLALGNLLHEDEQVKIAHPDIRLGFDYFSDPVVLYDYYHTLQESLKRVIGDFNWATAWDINHGNDTTIVAVIDNGYEPHEDLSSSRVLPPYNAVENNSNTILPTTRSHGLSVAGIVCADHTVNQAAGQSPNSGMISMDGSAKLLPIKLDLSLALSSHIVRAFDYAKNNGADVINCSWGGLEDEPPAVNFAIETAATLGRDGKGCVIVCAAGNHAWQPIASPARLPFVLAVTGRGPNDGPAHLSIGPEIDLFAPIQGFTLDEMGVEGYNNASGYECTPLNGDRDYMCAFDKTSAAAPVVAGAASLLLRKSPNLTRQEVFYILRHSADKTLDNGETATGDGDISYGHGRVDAFRALLSVSRGDCANDGGVDISDLTRLIDMLFISLQPLYPTDLLGDVNCDSYTDIADLTHLIDYLFIGQPALVVPCFELGGFDD